MPSSSRSRRTDATRNRARVLEAAFTVFSEQGTSAPISQIAARAGVGPGTIYRHFPTKEDLFSAVVAERFGRVAELGESIRRDADPGEAFLTFMRALILQSTDNRALAEAIISSDFDTHDAESAFLNTLDDLLNDAQKCGSIRSDVSVTDVKALLAACFTVRSYGEQLAEPVLRVVLDGLRSPAGGDGRGNSRLRLAAQPGTSERPADAYPAAADEGDHP